MTQSPSPRPNPFPPGTLKLLLQVLGVLLLIGGGITAIVLAPSEERDAVRKYVALLREGKLSEAHGMLASERAAALSVDGLKTALHTPLLSRSTDLTIVGGRGSGPGKSCTRTSVDHPGGSDGVYFYLIDENGPKIHTVLANDDFNTGKLVQNIEPWSCN